VWKFECFDCGDDECSTDGRVVVDESIDGNGVDNMVSVFNERMDGRERADQVPVCVCGSRHRIDDDGAKFE
jgi:hypothetical protein